MFTTNLKKDQFLNYTSFFNMLSIINFLKIMKVLDRLSAVINSYYLKTASAISLNRTTHSFFKEGFFIDCLQKITTDNLLKVLTLQTIQFFDLNSYKVVRFFIDDVYKPINNLFSKGDELSVFNVFSNLILSFLLVIQFVLTVIFWFYFIS